MGFAVPHSTFVERIVSSTKTSNFSKTDLHAMNETLLMISFEKTLIRLASWPIVSLQMKNKLGLSCARLSLAPAKLHTSLSSDQLKLATN